MHHTSQFSFLDTQHTQNLRESQKGGDLYRPLIEIRQEVLAARNGQDLSEEEKKNLAEEELKKLVNKDRGPLVSRGEVR